MTPRFVLFSGHNERAVVALSRYFTRAGLDFEIVSSGRDDAIHRTGHAGRVTANRTDGQLCADWLCALNAPGRHVRVAVPTSEFLNHFLLEHRATLECAGFDVGLPPQAAYERLTGKASSAELVSALIGLQAPPVLPWTGLAAPCVIKPRRNVGGGGVRYPALCRDAEELERALAAVEDRDAWFAQAWVDGRSLYLCAYLARDGRHAAFWQENLLQQGGGKSMLLARGCRPPSVDVPSLLHGLHATGYFGPLMMEVIEDTVGRLHYIEINPRFWGPLQLALDVCPEILALFARDHGGSPAPVRATSDVCSGWYAWAAGARRDAAGRRRYPGLASESDDDLRQLLERHDVYRGPDTCELHLTH